MEMKENEQKKMLLSVLGVAILVVAVIGISFAVYSTVFKSAANSISTGTIMVSYNESGSAINVVNAMPMSDEAGAAQTGSGTFVFQVSTKADNTLTVPYEISLTKVESAVSQGETGYYASLADNQVKAYLIKGVSPVSETMTDTGSGTTPGKLISALASSTVRNGAKVLHVDSDSFTGSGQSVVITNYILKLWIDHDVDISTVENMEYHAKVNVDSHVDPLS